MTDALGRASGLQAPELEVEVRHVLGKLQLQAAFSVPAGITVLFGPSGTGKTTLLRAIAGLLRPDQGRIYLRGEPLTDTQRRVFIRPERRRIGFVTQRPALFPHLTAEQNVGFGLSTTGPHTAAPDGQVDSMLRLFYAEPFRKRRPRELSGGEQQRIALARALAPQPRLLLLDEPLTGMNAALKTAVLHNLTAYLAEHAIPLVYVTHELPEVFALGAYVLLLEQGRIVGQGPAHEVLAPDRERLLEQLQHPRLRNLL